MSRWLLIAALAFPVACGGEEPAEDPAPEEPVQEEPIEEEPVAEAEPTEEEIPIPEDFEDEAAAEITADNFASVLDELEAEINADEP